MPTFTPKVPKGSVVVTGSRTITVKPKSASSAKSRTKVDKRQDRQLRNLRKLVVGQKEMEEAYYTVNKNQLPTNGIINNLINYDNEINYPGSTIQSRTYFRLSSSVLIQGQSGGAGSTTDSQRVIRVLYFMWKCDIEHGATTPSQIVHPTLYDVFDDFINVNDALSIQRTTYKNRDRIRILKDRKLFLTNHGNGDDDMKLITFNKNYKYGLNMKRYVNDDSFGSKKVWMPYVLILDGAGSNASVDNCFFTIVNQPLYNQED